MHAAVAAVATGQRAAGSASAVSVRNSEAHPLGQRISRARAFPRHTAATVGSSSSPTRLRRCLQAITSHHRHNVSATVPLDSYQSVIVVINIVLVYDSPTSAFSTIIISYPV